jgi:hypothetical protein
MIKEMDYYKKLKQVVMESDLDEYDRKVLLQFIKKKMRQLNDAKKNYEGKRERPLLTKRLLLVLENVLTDELKGIEEIKAAAALEDMTDTQLGNYLKILIDEGKVEKYQNKDNKKYYYRLV